MKAPSLFVLCCCMALVLFSCKAEDHDPPPPPANTAPSLVVTTPSSGQTGDVTVAYSLADDESHTCTLSVEFSVDGGSIFSLATQGTGGDGVTGLTSSSGGTAHTFVWDSVADGVATSVVNTAVQVRITPSDAAGGTPGTTGDFTVDNTGNTGPTGSVTTPGGTSTGLVTIGYSIVDTESNVCSIALEFSTDGGANYSAAMCLGGDGLTGLTSSAGGTSHTIVWNSFCDGVALTTLNALVRVRITPSDTLPGTSYATSDFTVDNTSLSSGAPVGGAYPIQYDPSNPNGGTDELFEIATDGKFLYLVGTNDFTGEWLIQKRNLDDGSLVTTFGTGGSVTSNPSSGPDMAMGIEV
ncbi:MAG: hypothetical protein ACYTFG_11170, partial [Planctomycetota bacterium]